MTFDLPWGALALNVAIAAGALAALMLGTWAVALARGGLHRIVDSAWGLGFALVAGVTLTLSAGHGDPARRALVTALTVAWGLRLALHLAWRGRGKGEDPRYAALLARAPGSQAAYALRTVYLLQGALILLVSLPVQVASYLPADLGATAWAGCALWAVGFGFEAVGDLQLARFKAEPAHRGRVMDRGLWRYTRHPNYFGDFLVWWGLYLLACGSWGAALTCLVSPLVMTGLLTAGSGKALLERSMADRPGYAEYAARTSGFVPLRPRSRNRSPDRPRSRSRNGSRGR
ncbi:DUF1295 domain-containing protein [Streptomyces hainanensis]|uniref:DUF1295 domain-containing protein n=1 Tax=Streptomyces hainanensis TaxID=402648 RepID=A0A4R4SFM1_9ACTN|nr:DUF1295 domain-containing protein [Streptomyces hainanensis]TDC61079.1 DUF1295 domain-containing protein [Streptomyces hainanensis]